MREKIWWNQVSHKEEPLEKLWHVKYSQDKQKHDLIRYNEDIPGSHIWRTAFGSHNIIQDHIFQEIREGGMHTFGTTLGSKCLKWKLKQIFREVESDPRIWDQSKSTNFGPRERERAISTNGNLKDGGMRDSLRNKSLGFEIILKNDALRSNMAQIG